MTIFFFFALRKLIIIPMALFRRRQERDLPYFGEKFPMDIQEIQNKSFVELKIKGGNI